MSESTDNALKDKLGLVCSDHDSYAISSCYCIIVKPNASQDEVDRIVDSNEPSQIFAQSVSGIRRPIIARTTLLLITMYICK